MKKSKSDASLQKASLLFSSIESMSPKTLLRAHPACRVAGCVLTCQYSPSAVRCPLSFAARQTGNTSAANRTTFPLASSRRMMSRDGRLGNRTTSPRFLPRCAALHSMLKLHCARRAFICPSIYFCSSEFRLCASRMKIQRFLRITIIRRTKIVNSNRKRIISYAI